MEDSCRGKSCWFYILMQSLIGKSDQELDVKDCPFYQEMVFTPDPVGTTAKTAKVIKDCVNKRSLLFLLEEMYPRMKGVQISQEEMRNRVSGASEIIAHLLIKSRQEKILFKEQNSQKEIDFLKNS